jgi:hypothetical protein
MSNPHLPAEMLDHVVDLLHDTKDALRNCCLVSKSWIPHTRKHLFTDIRFRTEEDLESWKKTFPDPSISPACYAKTLFVGCTHIVTAADAEPDGWIRGFSRVVHLEMNDHTTSIDGSAISLVPFHGFSPVVTSFHVNFTLLPSSRLVNLIFSLPLLEDLTVITQYEALIDDGDGSDGLSTVVQPSSPPIFTGSLELFLAGGMEPIARRLLYVGGIHFWKLTLAWFREDLILLTTALVEECSHILESLNITCNLPSTSIQHLRLHQ